MERTNALFTGVRLEVPHNHFPDEQPRGLGCSTTRVGAVRHELVLRFHHHFARVNSEPSVSL